TPGELLYHARRGQRLCITANLTANVSDGSKPVIPGRNRCFPVCLRKRTCALSGSSKINGWNPEPLQLGPSPVPTLAEKSFRASDVYPAPVQPQWRGVVCALRRVKRPPAVRAEPRPLGRRMEENPESGHLAVCRAVLLPSVTIGRMKDAPVINPPIV